MDYWRSFFAKLPTWIIQRYFVFFLKHELSEIYHELVHKLNFWQFVDNWWQFVLFWFPLLPPFRKALKEIIIQNITDFQQQIGVNPFAVENLVSVLSRVTELLGQPRDAAPFLDQCCLDDFPYMRFFVHRFAFAGALRGGQTKRRNCLLMLIS